MNTTTLSRLPSEARNARLRAKRAILAGARDGEIFVFLLDGGSFTAKSPELGCRLPFSRDEIAGLAGARWSDRTSATWKTDANPFAAA